ncbi:MAG: DUF4332 domain-containing protein [Deltaproteobacteria bacterium]|nr:MAG: DUF4332 domain-containing protein [Deltaproteobacteria bacterium]
MHRFISAFAGLSLSLLLAVCAHAHYDIADLAAFSPDEREALAGVSITDTEQFLAATLEAASRSTLAGQTGLAGDRLRELAGIAELVQVPGIGGQIAQLLVAAGIASLDELAAADPDALAERCAEVNRQQRLAPQPPPSDALRHWARLARDVPYRVQD